MMQSGHVVLDTPIWEMVTADYMRDPVIPVLDGEPNYQDLPVDPFSRMWPAEFGLYSEYDGRKQAYRGLG